VTALDEETPVSAASWPRDGTEISKRLQAFEERMRIKPSARTEGVAMPFRPETSNPEKVLDLRDWDLFVMYELVSLVCVCVFSPADPAGFPVTCQRFLDFRKRAQVCGADISTARSMRLSYPPRRYSSTLGSSAFSTRTRTSFQLSWLTKSLMSRNVTQSRIWAFSVRVSLSLLSVPTTGSDLGLCAFSSHKRRV
jgi:hypothetical protein